MKAKDLTILIYDNCEFGFIATYLSKYFKKVYYYSRWESGFPYYGAKNILSGVEGVIRVNEPEEIEDEIDIHYFTDIYFMGTANRLRREGRMVWGSGEMEMIERNRHIFHDLLVKAKLPTPPTEFIKGAENLMKYLKGKKNLWVKLSEYRGSGETFKWVDDDFNEFFTLELKRQLGPRGMKDKELEFLVQEEIETELEWGVDTYMVDSEFPENMYVGFEQKGEGYYGKLEKVRDLPESWQEVLDKFSKVVKDYHYTGTLSIEVRTGKDSKEYFIDPTVRQPYPATAATLYGMKNYPEILVNALYDNKPTKVEGEKYVAEVITRTCINNNWIPAYFDKKIADKLFWVNNLIDFEGITWRIPPEQLYCDSMKYCSALGSGSKLDDAIAEATEVLEGIKSKGLEFTNCMLEHSKTIKEQLKKSYQFNY